MSDDVPREFCGSAGQAVLTVLARHPGGLSTPDLAAAAYVSRRRLMLILNAGQAAGYLWSRLDERTSGERGGVRYRWGRTAKPLPVWLAIPGRSPALLGGVPLRPQASG